VTVVKAVMAWRCFPFKGKVGMGMGYREKAVKDVTIVTHLFCVFCPPSSVLCPLNTGKVGMGMGHR
jgi:hypothetical protein